jgi:hypothetical protein
VLPIFSPQDANCLQYEHHEHQKTDEHDGFDSSSHNEYEHREYDNGNDQQ